MSAKCALKFVWLLKAFSPCTVTFSCCDLTGFCCFLFLKYTGSMWTRSVRVSLEILILQWWSKEVAYASMSLWIKHADFWMSNLTVKLDEKWASILGEKPPKFPWNLLDFKQRRCQLCSHEAAEWCNLCLSLIHNFLKSPLLSQLKTPAWERNQCLLPSQFHQALWLKAVEFLEIYPA